MGKGLAHSSSCKVAQSPGAVTGGPPNLLFFEIYYSPKNTAAYNMSCPSVAWRTFPLMNVVRKSV